jgi:formylglycine-generating enzyme required for sulfatase activity
MTDSHLVRSLCLALPLLLAVPVCAADPTVTNVRAAQKTGTKQVEIFYDMSGSTSPVFVSLQISSNGGTTFAVPASALSGAVGAGVSLGSNKKITWNAGTDWNNQLSNTVKFRVTASDTLPAPAGFALIPAGSYTMGDALDGLSYAPTHTVTVSGFYMAQNLVTKAEWDAVRTWGLANGYTDLVAGSGKASNHPVQSITWYQMVKWCNARSQKGGFVPVYYTDDAQTTVYKTGDVNVTNAQAKWNANGYRLPTEAEWEKAARGGLSGKRFPWGDTISHGQANYYAQYTYYSYDLSGGVGFHPSYTVGDRLYTSPVGSFAANGYGLYDMAGNVFQWCWDWNGSYDPAVLTDPRGPAASGADRVVRGGGWNNDASFCRVADRIGYFPFLSSYNIGFRVARSSVQ